MNQNRRPILLRLSNSLREEAAVLAHSDGTSLNFFISLAVAEKIIRMREKQDPELVRAGADLVRTAANGDRP